MNQQAPILANVLAGLLRQRGAALLGDRRRVLGLLRDKVPNEGRATRILMVAYDQGVPARLGRGPISELDIGREVSLLSEETGVGLDLAREAVETWATALAHGGLQPGPAPAVRELPPVQPAPSAPAAAVQPLPAPPTPAPLLELPAAVAPQDGAEAPPPLARSPRAQPVTVRQVLKGPSARVPPAPELPPPAAPPRHEAATPAPVTPLPVQPLPVQPLPVQPLPVQRSADPHARQPSRDRAEEAPAAASAKGGGFQRWAGIVVGALALVSGGAKMIGAFSRGDPSATPPAVDSPVAPASTPPAAAPAGQTTAEGIATMAPGQTWPTYPFQRIKNGPDTMQFAFGLSYKGQAYTYYAAFALDTGKTSGASRVILVHGNQEIGPGASATELHTASKTGYYFESPSRIPNTYGAPDVCVFLNVQPRIDRLDPAASGALGVYGIDPRGGCDMKTVFGYANLKS